MSTEAATLERRAATYRDYPTEKKAEAVAAYEANGCNLRQTARQLGIPHKTLEYWLQDAKRLGELHTQKRGILADRLENIAYSLVDSIDEHDLSIVPLQNKATSLAIAIDKMQLLRGLPTSITESVERNELVVILQSALNAGLGEVIDVQPEPVNEGE